MPIHRLNEAADAAGGARRHHLRLGRQDRPVHRPARRAAARWSCTRFDGRAVLPRRVPARGVPGDPRRPAQPVRRHQRGPRHRWTRTATPNIDTVIKGDTVTRGAELRAVQRREADRPDAQGRGEGGAPGPHHGGREQAVPASSTRPAWRGTLTWKSRAREARRALRHGRYSPITSHPAGRSRTMTA